jgi:hypothetical protein
MAFAEVVPALTNGVVDCGVTGAFGHGRLAQSRIAVSAARLEQQCRGDETERWNRLDKRAELHARAAQGL